MSQKRKKTLSYDTVLSKEDQRRLKEFEKSERGEQVDAQSYSRECFDKSYYDLRYTFAPKRHSDVKPWESLYEAMFMNTLMRDSKNHRTAKAWLAELFAQQPTHPEAFARLAMHSIRVRKKKTKDQDASVKYNEKLKEFIKNVGFVRNAKIAMHRIRSKLASASRDNEHFLGADTKSSEMNPWSSQAAITSAKKHLGEFTRVYINKKLNPKLLKALTKLYAVHSTPTSETPDLKDFMKCLIQASWQLPRGIKFRQSLSNAFGTLELQRALESSIRDSKNKDTQGPSTQKTSRASMRRAKQKHEEDGMPPFFAYENKACIDLRVLLKHCKVPKQNRFRLGITSTVLVPGTSIEDVARLIYYLCRDGLLPIPLEECLEDILRKIAFALHHKGTERIPSPLEIITPSQFIYTLVQQYTWSNKDGAKLRKDWEAKRVCNIILVGDTRRFFNDTIDAVLSEDGAINLRARIPCCDDLQTAINNMQETAKEALLQCLESAYDAHISLKLKNEACRLKWRFPLPLNVNESAEHLKKISFVETAVLKGETMDPYLKLGNETLQVKITKRSARMVVEISLDKESTFATQIEFFTILKTELSTALAKYPFLANPDDLFLKKKHVISENDKQLSNMDKNRIQRDRIDRLDSARDEFGTYLFELKQAKSVRNTKASSSKDQQQKTDISYDQLGAKALLYQDPSL